MLERLFITDALRDALIAQAARAYPEECCGLIEGVREGEICRALALHATRNVASNPRVNFEIDPQIHFQLARALRGSGRDIIGCYHSHPDGAPAPSRVDRDSAAEDGFFWLIAAGNPRAGFALKPYIFWEVAGFVDAVLTTVP